MTYQIPAGYSRVVFEYAAVSGMGSQPCFGFGVNTGPSENLLDLCVQWWEESLKLRTITPYRLERIEARNDVEVLERTVGENGILVAEAEPPNTSALIRLGSGLVGRQHRGRMYWPGVLTADDVGEGGALDSIAVTSLQGVLAYLVDVLATDSYEIVILHSGVGAPTLVTSGAVQGTAATQRRRLRR